MVKSRAFGLVGRVLCIIPYTLVYDTSPAILAHRLVYVALDYTG